MFRPGYRRRFRRLRVVLAASEDGEPLWVWGSRGSPWEGDALLDNVSRALPRVFGSAARSLKILARRDLKQIQSVTFTQTMAAGLAQGLPWAFK